MKRSCTYCGRIHDRKHVCAAKPVARKEVTHVDRFRWTAAWKRKRVEIKERDLYMCQVCLHKHNEYTTRNLEVHHIIPIAKAWGKRLNNNNLITLCRTCHENAEKGVISVVELRGYIVQE